MTKIHNIQSLTFTETHLILVVDNQKYELPLNQISEKLTQASETEQIAYQISPSGYGIHWPLIDEDLSIDGLLKTANNLAISTKIESYGGQL